MKTIKGLVVVAGTCTLAVFVYTRIYPHSVLALMLRLL